jgi:hypothetical protein
MVAGPAERLGGLQFGLAVVAVTGVAVANSQAPNDWPYATGTGQATTYTLAAVGDIACEPDNAENVGTPASLKCGSATLGGLSAEYATAQQGEAMHPNLVALLGDEQYQVGKLSDFEQSFEQAGITQITAGSGGEALDTLAVENGTYSNPHVVTAQDQAFGVLNLSLHPDSYSWDYQPALAGPGANPATAMRYSDSGSAACRG